ncbi:MAG: sigma-70 family RNA polymerase sigma factor [Planctomycetota bacterium]|nr:sigma-70 family RNA polymerase sigma factor [Planctomycetota bacterium]
MSLLSMTHISDSQAVEICRSGGEDAPDAFKSIYDRYARNVFGYSQKMLGNRSLAEDAVQETFTKLFRSLAHYDSQRPLKPYILKIAHNAVLDCLKRQKHLKGQQPLGDDQASQEPDARALATKAETKKEVEKALLALAPEHRSVLVLRHVRALKVQEIAEIHGCSDRAIRNRMNIAAGLLERELRRRGIVSSEGQI